MIERIQKYSPSLGHCWLILLAVFFGEIVSGLLLEGCPQSVSYFVSMLFPVALIMLLAIKSPADGQIQKLNAPKGGFLASTVFFFDAAVAMASIVVIIDPLTSLIPMPEAIKKVFEQVFYGAAPADLIISTCVLAPLLEEFLCRGVMLRGLSRRMSAPRAILWSAAFFAIMHANPWQAIPAFIIGAFFGWIYLRTGCIWLTVALHSLNNLISSLTALLWPQIGVDEGLLDILGTGYWYFFALAVIVLSMFFIYCHADKKTVSSEVQSDS